MRKALRWFALAWAGAVYIALLWLPLYRQVSETKTSDGSSTRTTGTATLAAVNGPRTYLLLAVPVLAAVVAVLPWRGRGRRAADLTAAAFAVAFVLLGLMTVGAFFLPAAAALVASTAGAGAVASRPDAD